MELDLIGNLLQQSLDMQGRGLVTEILLELLLLLLCHGTRSKEEQKWNSMYDGCPISMLILMS